jgi:hypothetical protein
MLLGCFRDCNCRVDKPRYESTYVSRRLRVLSELARAADRFPLVTACFIDRRSLLGSNARFCVPACSRTHSQSGSKKPEKCGLIDAEQSAPADGELFLWLFGSAVSSRLPERPAAAQLGRSASNWPQFVTDREILRLGIHAVWRFGPATEFHIVNR